MILFNFQEKKAQEYAIGRLINYLQASKILIPFAMLFDVENIHIFKWDGKNLSKSIICLNSAEVLNHYEPEFSKKQIFTLAIASCNPANFKTQAAAAQIVVSTLSDPKTFNYALSSEAPNVFTFIYKGLVAENGITGELEPALAESWEISPDKQRVVFTLRNNLKWSDGQSLTADDVVFSYNEIYFNKEIPTAIKDIVKIGENDTFPKVQKLSDRQVEFILPEPFAPFLRNAAVAILPAHALRESIITKDSEV